MIVYLFVSLFPLIHYVPWFFSLEFYFALLVCSIHGSVCARFVPFTIRAMFGLFHLVCGLWLVRSKHDSCFTYYVPHLVRLTLSSFLSWFALGLFRSICGSLYVWFVQPIVRSMLGSFHIWFALGLIRSIFKIMQNIRHMLIVISCFINCIDMNFVTVLNKKKVFKTLLLSLLYLNCIDA